jgi:hypothetical protein
MIVLTLSKSAVLSLQRTCVFSIFLILVFTGPAFSSSAKTGSYIGIKRFTLPPDISVYYTSMDIQLFQRLNFELLPQGIKPIILEDSIPEGCIAIASASVETVDSSFVLNFKIRGISGGEETKSIPLDNPADVVVDILALKIRHYLEQNVSGKLLISSTPLDCNVFLNGVQIGKTPVEFILEEGTYSVKLEKEYLYPFHDSVVINPGKELSLSASMRFEGHRLQPWAVTASIFTCCAVASQLIETRFRNDYRSLREVGQDEFDRYFYRYQLANLMKFIFLVPAATTWTISGYIVFDNHALKKRIFSAQ